MLCHSLQRVLMYEYNMHQSTNLDVNMYPRNGYYQTANSPYVGRNKTWAGAVQFCRDQNQYLCDNTDYCYLGSWPTSALLYTVHGSVEVR